MHPAAKKSVHPSKENPIFRRDISLFLTGLAVLVVLNLLAQYYFFRVDLTEDHRYSVSEATQDLLRRLDRPVTVTVYLEGDLPAGMQRLQQSIRETLDEFKVYAGRNLSYRFVDPLKATTDAQRKDFFLRLNELGIQQTNLFDQENGKRIQKVIFPGAVIRHNDQEAGVMLLKGDRTAGAQQALNQSVEGIEYELASTIRQLAVTDKPTVGLLRGHGELEGVEIAGLTQALSEMYALHEVNLLVQDSIPPYEVLMVNKPTQAFSEADKYKLDQYIMQGGKVLFFLDPLGIDMDSVGAGGSIAIPRELNLDDQLFRYGVRINKNLVEDIKSGVYPIVVGNVGSQPQIVPLPWPFFPIVNRYGDSPMVRNLDALYLKFVSNMDTVQAADVRKTPLVYTSPYSRVASTPVVVNLEELRQAPQPENFRSGPQPVAYLLEGRFTSVFRNRILPGIADPATFVEKSVPTRMIVFADGDMIRNEVNRRTNAAFPLGYDPITEKTFANQDFVLNALSYLTDENGLITARAKEIQVRPLDPVKIQRESLRWQLLNLAAPLLLLAVIGVVKYYVRKRKYTGFEVG